MSVSLELYGLARHWSGCASLSCDASTLGDALRMAAAACPLLSPACILDGRLRPGFLANVNGQRFTADPDTALAPGDVVLILSSDVGG